MSNMTKKTKQQYDNVLHFMVKTANRKHFQNDFRFFESMKKLSDFFTLRMTWAKEAFIKQYYRATLVKRRRLPASYRNVVEAIEKVKKALPSFKEIQLKLVSALSTQVEAFKAMRHSLSNEIDQLETTLSPQAFKKASDSLKKAILIEEENEQQRFDFAKKVMELGSHFIQHAQDSSSDALHRAVRCIQKRKVLEYGALCMPESERVFDIPALALCADQLAEHRYFTAVAETLGCHCHALESSIDASCHAFMNALPAHFLGLVGEFHQVQLQLQCPEGGPQVLQIQALHQDADTCQCELYLSPRTF